MAGNGRQGKPKGLDFTCLHRHPAMMQSSHVKPFASALASAMAQRVILGHARNQKSHHNIRSLHQSSQEISGSGVCVLVFGLRTSMAAQAQHSCTGMPPAASICCAANGSFPGLWPLLLLYLSPRNRRRPVNFGRHEGEHVLAPLAF